MAGLLAETDTAIPLLTRVSSTNLPRRGVPHPLLSLTNQSIAGLLARIIVRSQQTAGQSRPLSPTPRGHMPEIGESAKKIESEERLKEKKSAEQCQHPSLAILQKLPFTHTSILRHQSSYPSLQSHLRSCITADKKKEEEGRRRKSQNR